MKKKKKLLAFFLVCAMALTPGFSAFAAGNATTQTPSYSTVTQIFDWGAATTKVIVDLGQTVTAGTVAKDTFNVHVARTDPRPGVTIPTADAEGDRVVTGAYISDSNGKSQYSGNFVTLEMQVGPTISLGSPINYDFRTGYNYWINCSYTITQLKDIVAGSKTISGLVIDTKTQDVKQLVDEFKVGSFTNLSDNITLKYASYAPAKDKGKNALIIWLHGAGEGGTDGTLPISANKACNFASAEIQSYFGGAYVLAPQCPTMWMQGPNGEFGGINSKYENALMALIKNYVSKHSDVDKNRIYVGGDSNGGYMTMLLARDYSNYFAAAMPTCEALADSLISDSDIQKIKNIPIWFTAAKTDTTVNPSAFVVPTYNRLVSAGAKNIHFSFFDKVVDTSGQYFKNDGTPYEYFGHWSWIYLYNNQCTDTVNGRTITVMEWLAAQRLHHR